MSAHEFTQPFEYSTGLHNGSVRSDGTIEALNKAGRRLIAVLRLDSAENTAFRRTIIEIVALAKVYAPEVYRRMLAFPRDLPNLASLRPPDGNQRPEGIRSSYFHQRQVGILPDIY